MTDPAVVEIVYDQHTLRGRLSLNSAAEAPVWERLQQAALTSNADYSFNMGSLELPWHAVLALIREFGPQQKALSFRFRPVGDDTKKRIATFVDQFKQVQSARGTLRITLSEVEISERLIDLGFTKRTLRPFQLRDLQRLLALANGANFSVPGAGKTTVTLALHLLTRTAGQHLMVVGPKASFPAWRDVVDECMAPDAPDGGAEQFTVLSGSAQWIENVLQSGRTRFVINYDLIIQMPDVFATYLATHPVHLVLDEAHRMKSGLASLRGALLLNVAPLPVRRDILTGTPMPQSASDVQSQLDFLWPGAGLGLQIGRGSAPRDILGSLYVRTTKEDLGLPKPIRHFVHVEMAKGQMALYGIVRSEFLRHATSLKFDNRIDLAAAKRAVVRLLQLSANPSLALRSIVDESVGLESGILDQVIAEGASSKMRAVADFARELAAKGRKSVIWTIFTDTIVQMEGLLADLNPVSLYGAIPSGEPDEPATREGRIRRFHRDPSCMVLIANPAAAGEGISLHKAAHDAIYIDRSFVTTHYLQSIDRIHRLGLEEGVETNIWIFQTLTPSGMGSIDHSVSRRLAQKLRAMQILLDDPDLHEIALDEENSEEPVDWDIDPEDVRDLIAELEKGLPYDELEGA
jgi:SNF2 family DNA or RNA helicase